MLCRGAKAEGQGPGTVRHQAGRPLRAPRRGLAGAAQGPEVSNASERRRRGRKRLISNDFEAFSAVFGRFRPFREDFRLAKSDGKAVRARFFSTRKVEAKLEMEEEVRIEEGASEPIFGARIDDLQPFLTIFIHFWTIFIYFSPVFDGSWMFSGCFSRKRLAGVEGAEPGADLQAAEGEERALSPRKTTVAAPSVAKTPRFDASLGPKSLETARNAWYFHVFFMIFHVFSSFWSLFEQRQVSLEPIRIPYRCGGLETWADEGQEGPEGAMQTSHHDGYDTNGMS